MRWPRSTQLECDRTQHWLARATWAFVSLGVLLRIARYAMNYPLWWDEAFVAVNLIRRGYVDLLRPLDYGQVCPMLFLWCELTAVKLLGFSEWSLRLFPLVSSIASLILFRCVAGRIVRGVPLLLAVAIFAVSFHPILHAADVKPYASDLLAALAIIAVAIEFLKAPERARWLWAFAVIAPVAIGLSHPAIFVAAGTMLGLAPAVVTARRRELWIAYATSSLASLTAFIVLYTVFTRAQAAANLAAMQTQWEAAFPPVNDPLALVRWLVTVHTGSMFAYPCGGEKGASSLTLVLFIMGAGALWFRRRKAVVLTCLAPFAIAFAAAALKRYPYGGPVPHGSPARVMQYLAPTICLFAGIGAAFFLEFFRYPRVAPQALRTILVFLAAIGIVPLAADAFHPYRAIHAQRARQFARQFWPQIAQDAEPVCLRWDLGIPEWDSANLNVAVYLCNQRIYSPGRQKQGNPGSHTVFANRPLRCVLPLADPSSREVKSWLDAMKNRYRLREWRPMVVDMAEPGAKPRTERYDIYEFVPIDLVRHEADDHVSSR
jgi:4-amino-4-deoxy-L-arabinose transferase-like glycosyltransferase